MTALPAKLYRDPLETLIDLQEGSCQGCRNERTITVAGQEFTYCQIRPRHGYRCKQYDSGGRDAAS